MRLRDHDRPCEHPLDPLAMYDGAYRDEDGLWRCGQCPGGAEVTIDSEAARRLLWQRLGFIGLPAIDVRDAVNAALGIVEEDA